MAGDRKKWEAQQDWPKVRAILLEEWDPILVRDVPQAQDEYDCYIGGVYSKLMDQQATREALSADLFDIATRHMGLAKTPWLSERCDRAAAALVRLRTPFEAH